MKSISMALSAALIAGMTTAATADPRLGSRLGPDLDRQYHSKASADQQARIFVSCMLKSHPALARTMLDATDKKVLEKTSNSLAEVDSCDKLNTDETADVGGFAYPLDILRGMVAEQLIATRLDQAANFQRLPVARAYARPWFAMTGRDQAVDAMAVCLADSNPAGDVVLLRAGAYSPAEMAAVQAIGPSLGQCLQAGYKLHANRQTLRAAIAEGLYHRLMDPPVPVSAPTGKQP